MTRDERTMRQKNRQKQTAKEPGAQGSQQRRRKPAAGGKNSTKTQK